MRSDEEMLGWRVFSLLLFRFFFFFSRFHAQKQSHTNELNENTETYVKALMPIYVAVSANINRM